MNIMYSVIVMSFLNFADWRYRRELKYSFE